MRYKCLSIITKSFNEADCLQGGADFFLVLRSPVRSDFIFKDAKHGLVFIVAVGRRDGLGPAGRMELKFTLMNGYQQTGDRPPPHLIG